MSSLSPCVTSAITGFLTDIDVPASDITTVISHTNNAVTAYEAAAPQVTPIEIAIDLYNCGQKEVNKILDNVSAEIIFAQIALSVIIIVIAIVIATSFILTGGATRLFIITVALLLGIIAIYILYVDIVKNIDDLLVAREKNINICIDSAQKQLNQYEVEQEAAINKGFCAYG